MKETILKFENISKQYRLGLVGTGTISHDLNRWWSKLRGKQDPYLKIGETDKQRISGNSEYVWALKDINIEVLRGEVLGVIGRNGAGKSTLLKILSKVTSPTTGTIKSRGRIASLLEVGTGFHAELTGKENIFLNGAILGMTKREISSKLDEIVTFSGCERYIDTPVKRYSSGMTVRLAFAVAAHLEPEILVVDEVLAVGDVEFQKKAIGKMQNIAAGEGRTVLFVSHDMNAISRLCTRLIVLSNGESEEFGNVDEGIASYLASSSKSDTIKTTKMQNNIAIKKFDILRNTVSERNIKVFSEIKIKFELEFLKNIPAELKVAILIKDAFGQVQTTISSWLNALQITPKTNKQSFECDLSHGFSLNEGSYYIDLHVYTNTNTVFTNIYSFNLMNSEVTGYKRPLSRSQSHGRVYTPNSWKIS